jgi:hypothetical protein
MDTQFDLEKPKLWKRWPIVVALGGSFENFNMTLKKMYLSHLVSDITEYPKIAAPTCTVTYAALYSQHVNFAV